MVRARGALLAALVASACHSLDERPASFRYLHQAIIAPNCATIGCHSAASAVAGLELQSSESAYRSLVGSPCSDAPPARAGYLVPGDASSSYLIVLLRGESEAFSVMPPDRLLPLRDVDLIARWIDDGALCD